MVCLTSCVFRSIRFSGFARPHIGVRREGELYTQAQGGGKRSMGSPRDAHKSGNDSNLGVFPAHMAGIRGLRAGRRGRASPHRRRAGPPIALATHTYMFRLKPGTETQGAPTGPRLSWPGGAWSGRARRHSGSTPARLSKQKRPVPYCKETGRTRRVNYVCWRKPICSAAFTPARAP